MPSANCKFVKVSKNIDLNCVSVAIAVNQMRSENNKSKMQKKNIEKYDKIYWTRLERRHHTQTHPCITNCCVNFISLSVNFKLTCGFYVCVCVCAKAYTQYVCNHVINMYLVHMSYVFVCICVRVCLCLCVCEYKLT